MGCKMANHAKVKTKKKMTPEKVTEVLEALNKRIFNGNLKIEYHNEKGNKGAWGPHVWMFSYISHVDGKDYDGRVMWLNNSKSFEIRHGGGCQFVWWMDTAITNEIAYYFDGYVIDDSDMEKRKPIEGQYDDYKKYALHKNTMADIRNDLWLRYYYQDIMEFTPPEFRFDTGKKVIHVGEPLSGIFKEV